MIKKILRSHLAWWASRTRVVRLRGSCVRRRCIEFFFPPGGRRFIQNPARPPIFPLGSRRVGIGFHFPSRPPTRFLRRDARLSSSKMTRRRRRGGSRGRVPRELHQAYGALARTLGHAVLSLLPPPTPAGTPCSACRGRGGAGCLACRRWGYLLRDGDPVAYRNLITRAVCAVAPAGSSAPAPPRYTPGNAGHSQAKVPYDSAYSPRLVFFVSPFLFRAYPCIDLVCSCCLLGI